MKSSEDVTTLVDTFETAYKSCMRFIYNLNEYCYENQLLIDTRREDALHCFNLTPVDRNYKFSGPIEFGALEKFGDYISNGVKFPGNGYDDDPILLLKDFVRNESERQGCFIRLAYSSVSQNYPIYKIIEEEQRTQFLAEQNKISTENMVHRLELTCDYDQFIDDQDKLLPFTFKVRGLVGLYSNDELRWDEDKIENASIGQISVPIYWEKKIGTQLLGATNYGICLEKDFNHANLIVPTALIVLEKSIGEELKQRSPLFDMTDPNPTGIYPKKFVYKDYTWFQINNYNNAKPEIIQEPLNYLIKNALGLDKDNDSDPNTGTGIAIWKDFHNLTQLKDYQAVYGARLNEIMKAELSARFVVEMCRQMLLGHQIEVNGYIITVNEICTDPYEDGPTIIGIDDLGDEIEVGGPEMITVLN